MPVVSTLWVCMIDKGCCQDGRSYKPLSPAQLSAQLQICISTYIQNLFQDISTEDWKYVQLNSPPTNCCFLITNALSSSYSQVRNLEVSFPLPHKRSSVSPIYTLLRVSLFRCPRLQHCTHSLLHDLHLSSSTPVCILCCHYKCLKRQPWLCGLCLFI